MHLTEGLRRARDGQGDAVAVVFGEQRWTWSQFGDRVARLASVFRAHGAGAGDRIAMLGHSSHRYLEYYYAALWSGGVICPMNTRHSLPELLYQAEDSAPAVLIVDDAFAHLAEPIRQALPDLKLVLYAGDADAPAGMLSYEDELARAPTCADAERGHDDLACLFYTGGTTGRAKGVMLSHANLLASIRSHMTASGPTPPPASLHAGPLFHLAAGSRVFSTTLTGGRHIVLPAFAPADVLRTIARERVTAATFVPTMLAMVMRHPEFDAHDLSSLELISYGASPMPETLLREAIRRFPNARFAQSYGMTETSPLVARLGPEDHQPDGPTSHRLRSAGRPAPGVEVRIVDAEDRVLPVGEVGEIIARGPNVMLGYWRKPEQSAAAMRGGWMHTGDAGRFDADGYLYVVDRTKDMIISGGENIYSTEVENALLQHPDVAQCAVIAVPHATWGEAVHAVIVPREGADLDADALIAHCRSLIAGYKCPRSIEFRNDGLPLSSVNKVDKAKLREPFWNTQGRQVS